MAWWLLAIGDLYPGDHAPNPREFSSEANSAAIAKLFELLDEYLSDHYYGVDN